MTFETHLQFGDKKEELYNRDYRVVEFHSLFSRKHSDTCPLTGPDCSSLELTLVVPYKSDLELHEWFFTKSLKSGRILFEVMDLNVQGEYTSPRALYFHDAQCFSLGEEYDIDGGSLRLVRLSVHCRRSEMAGVSFGCDDESPDETYPGNHD